MDHVNSHEADKQLRKLTIFVSLMQDCFTMWNDIQSHPLRNPDSSSNVWWIISTVSLGGSCMNYHSRNSAGD